MNYQKENDVDNMKTYDYIPNNPTYEQNNNNYVERESKMRTLNLNNNYNSPNNQIINSNESKEMDNSAMTYQQERNNRYYQMNNIDNNDTNNNEKLNMSLPLQAYQKINELDLSINEINKKHDQLVKSIESMKQQNQINTDRNQMYNKNMPILNQPSFSNDQNINNSNTTLLYLEYQKMKQNQATLVSDNIIFKEDINRLSDINKHLELELQNQINRNYDLNAENDRLNKDNLNLHNQVEKTNALVAQVKYKENNLIEALSYRKDLECRLRENNFELNKLREENSQLKVDYNLLLNKYNDLNSQYEKCQHELDILNKIQTEKLSEVETRLNSMTKEIDTLRNENSILRNSNEKFRSDLVNSEQLKDNFKDKYQQQKSQNNLLNNKLNEICNEVELYKKESQENESKKLQEEQLKKSKIESKNRIVSELQRRITNYKNDRLKNKNNNFSYSLNDDNNNNSNNNIINYSKDILNKSNS